MRNELARHRLAYFVLISGVIIFVGLFLGAWPNRWIQRAVILGMASFYFIWGTLTHVKTKTVTKQVIAEYGMVALLAALLLLLITI